MINDKAMETATSMRLPAGLKWLVHHRAKAESKSPSQVIRDALEAHLITPAIVVEEDMLEYVSREQLEAEL